ncbi:MULTISPECIES: response regulator [unclassified Lentimicrobium]|uniref:response regulator n=1 Tax=unclassified Lentimicrobium TaxID=2677434 RepID=UPI0015574AD0|nr:MULTISPECIES: response regulator [unclassified Lentimicrobium]NPD46176.1 response regulator [Lentimicrobium sp. S6]NPD83227.1 response regulator [Lentimicrobium sp. L6]
MNESYNVNEYQWEGKTVLIAEDITSNYNFLRLLLKRSKIEIIWVENGQDALTEVQNNDNIDLLLLDINLPIMNGYEAAEAIKKIRPELPIIAQTAYALEGDREKALLAGCDDYIPKPIVISTLLRKMNGYLNQ